MFIAISNKYIFNTNDIESIYVSDDKKTLHIITSTERYRINKCGVTIAEQQEYIEKLFQELSDKLIKNS